MRYVSTRDASHTATLDEAILRGIAPDGGLYVPESFPTVDPEALAEARGLPEVAERLLAPFFEGSSLEGELREICESALSFPVPLRMLRTGTAVLELFHGPTAAFKDVGARFLAECLPRLAAGGERPLLLLVATSGDTGGAVAAAFHGKQGVQVAVLYPKGRVSPRQERQLTAWGDNVRAFAVRGDFDDCQRLVKAALADPAVRAEWATSSANSINLGRLLPQMAYYAAAALEYRRARGVEPGFIIPSGNVGNATACLWARAAGVPMREIALATNANPALSEFAAGAEWAPHPTVQTLANAMDVGNPSNIERIFDLFGGQPAARPQIRAERVEDDEIRDAIRNGLARWGEVWDPHTATAVVARERLGGRDWILVSTAHPAKFETVVEPLIGREVPIPPALAELLERQGSATEIDADLGALREALPAPHPPTP
jgi:threonine synthase